MPPEFATFQKEFKDSEKFINERIERFLDTNSPANDDYDPDCIIDDIETTLDGLLLTFSRIRGKLPSRTEQDLDARDQIGRATKMTHLQN